MKLLRNAALTAVAAVSVLGVVAPAAQAAPRPTAAPAAFAHHHHRHHHHRRCWWDRDQDHMVCRDHGVDAGGGALAASVARLTKHIGG